MATKNTIPSQLHDPVHARVTLVNADGTSYKTVLAVTGSDNSEEVHLFSINLLSDDTVSRDLRFAINDGTNDIEQGDIAVAASSGYGVATPPLQGLANLTSPKISRVLKDIRGNWFLALRSGETLKVKAVVAVTAAKTIVVSVFGWNFKRS